MTIGEPLVGPCGLREPDTQLLQNLPLFSGLSEPELFHLIQDSWVDRFPAGTLLFLHGDPARSFFVVLEGWVKLYRSTPDGDEGVIAVLPAGDSFAEAAAFESGTFPVSAAVVEDARILTIAVRPFLEKVLSDRSLTIKMMAALSRRLRLLVHQVEELSLKTSTERLAGYLTTLVRDEIGSTVVRLPLEKALIARHLGMQPETLSRSFARLKARGIVAEGDMIRIPDVLHLRNLAGATSLDGGTP